MIHIRVHTNIICRNLETQKLRLGTKWIQALLIETNSAIVRSSQGTSESPRRYSLGWMSGRLTHFWQAQQTYLTDKYIHRQTDEIYSFSCYKDNPCQLSHTKNKQKKTKKSGSHGDTTITCGRKYKRVWFDKCWHTLVSAVTTAGCMFSFMKSELASCCVIPDLFVPSVCPRKNVIWLPITTVLFNHLFWTGYPFWCTVFCAPKDLNRLTANNSDAHACPTGTKIKGTIVCVCVQTGFQNLRF